MHNWVHLDLKGTIPAQQKLLDWITWLAKAGFSGIVWEYEDRLPWKSLPGTFRPGYSLEQWKCIWRHCRNMGLRTMPLVQTFGHLEWMLRQGSYAHLREAGHLNQLCPRHPDSAVLIKRLLEEVIELHPDSEFIHLGADETWNLATCSRCQANDKSLQAQRINVYLEYINGLCDFVLAKGKIPLIWADMFWRENAESYARQLPPKTILVDWHYDQNGPWKSTDLLRATDRQVWGASAIRCGYDQKYLLSPIQMQLDNIAIWQELLAQNRVSDVIHTVWGRANTLRPIYGPWEGWIPAFLAAGDPQSWNTHPLKQLAFEMNAAMTGPEWMPLEPLQKKINEYHPDDVMISNCLEWWKITLYHRDIWNKLLTYIGATHTLEGVATTAEINPNEQKKWLQYRADIVSRVAHLESDVYNYWTKATLSDMGEYLTGKIAVLRRLLES